MLPHQNEDIQGYKVIGTARVKLLVNSNSTDYEGATGVNFTSVGEASGSFLEKEIENSKFRTVKQR